MVDSESTTSSSVTSAWATRPGGTRTTDLSRISLSPGNFFLRYPICAINLAPYVVVGGGGAWGQGEGIGYGNVGAGLEYRITDHIGLFADGRYFYGGTGNVANLPAAVSASLSKKQRIKV